MNKKVTSLYTTLYKLGRKKKGTSPADAMPTDRPLGESSVDGFLAPTHLLDYSEQNSEQSRTQSTEHVAMI